MKGKIAVIFLAASMLIVVACNEKNKYDQNMTTNIQQQDEKEFIEVAIYKVNENTGEIATESRQIEKLTEKKIWDLLKETGVMGEETEVLSLEKSGRRLNLDLNKAFGDQLRSYGTSGEQMLLICIVNTFLDAYECEEMKITEDGKTLVSGHAEYKDYFQKFQK